MRGDDLLALQDSAALLKDRDAYEAEASKRLGAPWLERQRMNPPEQGSGLRISLLTPSGRALRRLPAALRCRAEEAHRLHRPESPLVQGSRSYPDRPSGRSGGSPVGPAGRGQRLRRPHRQGSCRRRGAPRATRCWTPSRKIRASPAASLRARFLAGSNLITVKTAAYGAFKAIVQVDEFSPDGSQPDLATLRAYWAQNKSFTPAERWYRTPPTITPDAGSGWKRRPAWLSRPRSRTSEPGRRWRTGSRDPEPPMKGEPLRSSTPSISNLMAETDHPDFRWTRTARHAPPVRADGVPPAQPLPQQVGFEIGPRFAAECDP